MYVLKKYLSRGGVMFLGKYYCYFYWYQLVADFAVDVAEELVGRRIQRTSEHEVVEHHQPKLQ